MKFSRVGMLLTALSSWAAPAYIVKENVQLAPAPAGAGKNEARYRRATGHTVAMGKRAAIKARNRQRNKAAHRGRHV